MPSPIYPSKTIHEWDYYVSDVHSMTNQGDPSKATVCQDSGAYKVEEGVNGPVMVIEYQYYHDVSTGATAGTGVYGFTLPEGFEIDTTRVVTAESAGAAFDGSADDSNLGTMVGVARAYDGNNIAVGAMVQVLDKDHIGIYTPAYISNGVSPVTGENKLISNLFFSWGSSGHRITYEAIIPVVKIA